MLITLKKSQKVAITSPFQVKELLWTILESADRFDRDKEHFFVLGLSRSNTLMYLDLVSVGSSRGTIAEPKEIFRRAIAKNANSIIISHNHPSNSNKPIHADILLTKKIIAAGKIISIKVLDHVIITKDGLYSFEWKDKTTGISLD